MNYRGLQGQLSILTRAGRYLSETLSNQLLGHSCLLCHAPAGRSALCIACQNDLPELATYHCPCCAEPTAFGERCGRCLVHPPSYRTCHALYHYAFPIDRLIQEFKYGHQLAVGQFFGSRLAEQLPQMHFDQIMPLPLHPNRLAARGFNQSVEIARPIARHLRCPISLETLIRQRETESQAVLPLKARTSNVRGAFACTQDLSGRHILLVDDVMTSGATLEEAARTLTLHGATVELAVIARAVGAKA